MPRQTFKRVSDAEARAQDFILYSELLELCHLIVTALNFRRTFSF